jgi:phosphoribosyl-ATP pyrophosphohydrolase
MAKPTKKLVSPNGDKKNGAKDKPAKKRLAEPLPAGVIAMPPLAPGGSPEVLDRLWSVVMSRRGADPTLSHSARLLSRGTAKIAQKFGEEAVECLIEAARGNRTALVAESADVLYHLIVMWVDAGVRADEVWAELQRREGMSGVAEKAMRPRELAMDVAVRTKKIP